jgi:hypothetical protein
MAAAPRRRRQPAQQVGQLPEALGGDVGVTGGGLQVAVPQDLLQRHQIDLRFQQVGGVAVPQRVEADAPAEAAGQHRPVEQPLHGGGVQRPPGLVAGEQPVGRPVAAPVHP